MKADLETRDSHLLGVLRKVYVLMQSLEMGASFRHKEQKME